ncbi:hypothetical protein ACIQ9J_02060 [Streptomyces sp. NPDC094153]|uniref:hypothetical protein n=1 Tax=Streptomyces sp. NPDC094153 TaxID=3366058 RepID=UPI0037FB0102
MSESRTPPGARTRTGVTGSSGPLVVPGPVPCSRWRPGGDSPVAVPRFGAVAVKR